MPGSSMQGGGGPAGHGGGFSPPNLRSSPNPRSPLSDGQRPDLSNPNDHGSKRVGALPLVVVLCAAGVCEALGTAALYTAGAMVGILGGTVVGQSLKDTLSLSDNAREKDLLKHLSDSLGIPWKKLSDELHKIKKAAGLKGREVDIAPDGTVFDPVSGEEIGNLTDE